jgi:hypothetical protein
MSSALHIIPLALKTQYTSFADCAAQSVARIPSFSSKPKHASGPHLIDRRKLRSKGPVSKRCGVLSAKEAHRALQSPCRGLSRLPSGFRVDADSLRALSAVMLTNVC